jgi:hypothetical protein
MYLCILYQKKKENGYIFRIEKNSIASEDFLPMYALPVYTLCIMVITLSVVAMGGDHFGSLESV